MEDSKIGISTQTLVSSNGSLKSARKLPQFVAALSVTLGAFALGNVLAWTSPANPLLEEENGEFHYSKSQTSWIGATMALGAAVVVIPMGFFLDRFGRKPTMLAIVLPFMVGWLLIVFADIVPYESRFVMFIIGRFITGMMGGAFSLTAPVYTSEIAQTEIRGMLGSFFQLMVTVGILFMYVLGSFASLTVLSSVCAAVPVVFGVIFFFMPETPLQYLRTGRESDARKSLQWFRGPEYDIETELQEIKNAVEKAEREKSSFKEAFSTPAAKKGLLIAFGLMVFQQLSGVNAVIFYATDIFEAAGSSLDADIASIIVGVVQTVSTLVSTMVVDKLGRRILLLTSGSVMAICTLVLGVFFYLLKEWGEKDDRVVAIGWLPLASLCIFMVVFSLGYGPIPWMMMGELFPSNIKEFASSLSCLLNWILAFIVTKFYSDMKDAFGTAATFWIFTVISALGTVFMLFFLPETKGKSLEEIQQQLGGGGGGLSLSAPPTTVVTGDTQKTDWPESQKY